MTTSASPVSIMAHLPAKVPSIAELTVHVGLIHPFAVANKPGKILDGFNEAKDALAAYANVDQFGNPPKEEIAAQEFKKKVLDAVKLPLSATVFRRAPDLLKNHPVAVPNAIAMMDEMRGIALEGEAVNTMQEGAAILWPELFRMSEGLKNYLFRFPSKLSVHNSNEGNTDGASFILNSLGIPFEASNLEGISDLSGLLDRFPQLRSEVERRLMRIVSNVPDASTLETRYGIDKLLLKTAASNGLISDTALEGMLNSMRTYTNAERRNKRLREIGWRTLWGDTVSSVPAALTLLLIGFAFFVGLPGDMSPDTMYDPLLPQGSFDRLAASRKAMKFLAKTGAISTAVLSVIIIGRSIWHLHALNKAERDHPDVQE